MPVAERNSAAANEELIKVAEKVFWWCTPEEALGDIRRFVAQVMTFGDWDDVRTSLSVLGEGTFRSTLVDFPPGIIDERSWHYWHHYFRSYFEAESFCFTS